MFIPEFSRTLIISFSALLAIIAPLGSVAEVMQPVQEKGTTLTTDFGELPNEIIWADDGSVMLLIPAGTYTVGTSDRGLEKYSEDEGPEVQVTVGTYYIDKYEIEYDQYRKISAKQGLETPRIPGVDPSELSGTPVRAVSWLSASDYASAVRRELPTEAEWEIAARGREAMLYPWGNDPSPDVTTGLGYSGHPMRLGENPVDVSSFGVHDLGGNVGEWTADGFERDYHEKIENADRPFLDENTEAKTVRGGNYYYRSDGRATRRVAGAPNQTKEEIGFRTVFRLRKPPPPTPTPGPTPVPLTPTPNAETRIDAMREVLRPYLRNPSLSLPFELTGRVGETGRICVWNRSPLDCVIAVTDLDAGTIFKIDTVVPGGGEALVTVPARQLVSLFAFSAQSRDDSVVYLGDTNEAGSPLLVMGPGTFNRLVAPDGEVTPNGPDMLARQLFPGLLQIRWNEYSIINETAFPVDVKIGSCTADGLGMGEINLHVLLDPADVLFVPSDVAGTLCLGATYIGAADTFSGDVQSFKIVSGVDYHVFRLSPDRDGGGSTGFDAKAAPY